MSRILKAKMCTTGGEGHRKAISTSFENFKMTQIGVVLNRARDLDVEAGRPKRKLAPITTYLLEHMIQKYFTKYAPKGDILELIEIKDTNEI